MSRPQDVLGLHQLVDELLRRISDLEASQAGLVREAILANMKTTIRLDTDVDKAMIRQCKSFQETLNMDAKPKNHRSFRP